MFDPRILINCRDRVTDLRKLVEWLERAGHQRITLLDNASSYEPLLEYLNESPHDVEYLGVNAGARSIWTLDMVPDEWFVYTDPDVLPLAECPPSAVARLYGALQRHPGYVKAGLGLHLDDVPGDLSCLPWESGPQIRGPLIERGAYQSLIDTTFALYRPGAAPFVYEAIRTAYPYEARHSSWYMRDIDDEHRHYLTRAIPGPPGSSWAEAFQQHPS